MTCPVCKKEVADGSNFCGWCGQKLAITGDEYQEQESRQRFGADEESAEGEGAAEEEASRERDDRSEARAEDKALSPYYQQKFSMFDGNGGGFLATWNWAALFFGPFWYLYKGLWGKAILMFLLAVVFGGIPAPLFWIYTGLFGNWDYYLFWRKHTQWWS